MTTKTLRVPAQLRKHVLRTVEPDTKGERELIAACQAGAKELERQGRNNMNTIELELTNDALGVVLDLARDWLDDDNGNNVMAAKSMLKFELEYEPDDPREIRHAVKMPKSAMGLFQTPYSLEFKKNTSIPKPVKYELKHMSWASNGLSGRITNETLGWFLDQMKRQWDHPTPAVQRAVRKFIGTYTEPYEKTQRLINGYVGTDALENEEPEVQSKRLTVIACGDKKREGRHPAGDLYTGNYFLACRHAAEVMDGPTMILSAKHGLLPLDEEIESYDVQWGGKGSIRVGAVKEQVEAYGLMDAKVTVLGGERYVKAARQIWPDAEAPLKGGIGQQLKQLDRIAKGEDDEHQDQEPAEGYWPEEYKRGEFRHIPNLPSRGRSHEPVIWYGGKAGAKDPKPKGWQKVRVTYVGEGKYDLSDFETRETVKTCTLANQVFWAKADQEPAGGEPEVKDPLLDLIEETAPPKGGYEVPANFLELAEEGNTEAARRYWTRRCEEYRRTGK
ncbi:DUF6884 domain-containing protein [Streptomyces ardesiacus]|uniref:DUF6884 domain-containing protein n=1 Tax=Streptomyces ardesiacus TaxID=285564 RepID=UPI00382D4F88